MSQKSDVKNEHLPLKGGLYVLSLHELKMDCCLPVKDGQQRPGCLVKKGVP